MSKDVDTKSRAAEANNDVLIGRTDADGYKRVILPDGRKVAVAFGITVKRGGGGISGLALRYPNRSTVYFEVWDSHSGTERLAVEVSGRFPSSAEAARDAIRALETRAIVEWEHQRNGMGHELCDMLKSAERLAEAIAMEFGS